MKTTLFPNSGLFHDLELLRQKENQKLAFESEFEGNKNRLNKTNHIIAQPRAIVNSLTAREDDWYYKHYDERHYS